MELTFLGCGSGYSPHLNNTNAYFVKGDTFFLIDCGFTTFNELLKIESFMQSKNFVILITHLHADHVGSLSMTVSYSFNKLHRVPTLLFPLSTVVDLLTLSGIPTDQYKLVQQLDEFEGISAFPLSVEHTELMECFGYYIKDDDKKIFYSGDAALVPHEVLEGFHAGCIDEIYQDITYIEGRHPSHGTLDYLDSVILPEYKHKVYCMHFDWDFSEEVFKRGYQVVSCYTKQLEK